MSNEEIKNKINGFLDAQKRKRIVETIVTALLTCAAIAFGATSCNVVRTITNKSEYYQRGDTSVMIQTKTTESYDVSRK